MYCRRGSGIEGQGPVERLYGSGSGRIESSYSFTGADFGMVLENVLWKRICRQMQHAGSLNKGMEGNAALSTAGGAGFGCRR
ncbi:MAG: hypothetical protein DRO04_00115 [Candidatus Iainarchaeum archaeon]|uniref:Uncharacterized protein n=1 Tax=Candidatus Iainarchaeum sp. TaxID=3101447 RepID=A0A497JI98_9ARCH|nr:MAG: hypothetical protein DRO04_00115 [Candidatus Diapherotrites archaeon]